VARLVRVGTQHVCQGVLLDWQALQKDLAAEVHDVFPDASFKPVTHDAVGVLESNAFPPHPERTMASLPVELDPGPLPALADPGWTPLRIGLALAWAAALVALLAVALGGWSLIDLAQRRIRFVSTVTHELRTPLTTLRLYLDMLTGGMVREEQQKEEYLRTLNSETDRLNRLVGNVLDFSRLENQRPRLEKTTTKVSDLLELVRSTWQRRCDDAGKELVIDNALPSEAILTTDSSVVQQILGNLIDNACKYSRSAADRRIWLRARANGATVCLEIEDRGPGIGRRERRSIFRPFRRGQDADTIAGGVGLGLALCTRWATLLGGRLCVAPGSRGQGACFQIHLPANSPI
jgi:signal transduction histidine kinase